ncbi:MAG: DNA double-strand break repair nuclease NurA [Anaerolineaceae bacterium]|nr:DNA double-strand break repair nuclease NurA [Anaerolineaceae bacterium]
MPVNFLQIKQNLPSYTEKVKHLKTEEAVLENELWSRFLDNAENFENIKSLVEQNAPRIKNLWCACPTNESLLTHKPCPSLPAAYTILAADGSQIHPSRHKAVPYCVINIGVIVSAMGTGSPPECYMYSELIDYADLFNLDGGLINEDLVALWRDHGERIALRKHVETLSGPVITLTDGLLGLYMGSRSDRNQEPWANGIYAAYKALEEQGIISAGYIDKPGSDLIGRLFSLLALPENELTQYDAKTRAFKGISDRTLLENVLKKPGERSAIFKVVSTQDRKSENDLDVHFFFLNVGSSETPYLVRVEFPGWIARFEDRIDFLHAAIYQETCVLDTHPYPYILHRAHELAVIRMDEHAEVERLLMQAYQDQDVPFGMQSNKEANKIISGRRNSDE